MELPECRERLSVLRHEGSLPRQPSSPAFLRQHSSSALAASLPSSLCQPSSPALFTSIPRQPSSPQALFASNPRSSPALLASPRRQPSVANLLRQPAVTSLHRQPSITYPSPAFRRQAAFLASLPPASLRRQPSSPAFLSPAFQPAPAFVAFVAFFAIRLTNECRLCLLSPVLACAFCRQPFVANLPCAFSRPHQLFPLRFAVHCPFSGVFQHHKMCAKRGVPVDAREPDLYPGGFSPRTL